VVGDASDEDVAQRAAEVSQEASALSGWVNNAAVFRDASLHSDGAHRVLEAIAPNLINGEILPVDGGRSALGRDPEEA
jgi:hypothetical protein